MYTAAFCWGSAVEAAELRVDSTPPHVALENPPSGWSGGAVQVTAVAHDELSGMTASASTIEAKVTS